MARALLRASNRVEQGPGGTLVTMAGACLYLLDEHKKIADERDQFVFLSK